MQVKTDKQLAIAVGTGRKTKKWKNKTLMWSELLDKLASPVRTNETVAEYKAMSRERQSEIKDVGGFVGGYCPHGDRSAVALRSVLTLDADFADENLWGDWETIYGNAAAAYSTHKHTVEAPRLRLVIPLTRDVSPDEYVAIGRRVAADLGIDKFDDSTYQAQRLMYWPSCSRDGDFFFRCSDGTLLDADRVLATYKDWRDMSTWPMSSRVSDIVRKSAQKQKDPLQKPGVIGAFCRTYTVQEAIEKYVPEYTPCSIPGRYTFEGGSTAAGVVVYEDKFTFSHHATDPASGVLCNAWDLVRRHRFGELDVGKDEDTPPSKLPSYAAMRSLAMEDEEVRVALINARMAEADTDFEDLGEEEDDSWKRKLSLTEQGGIRSSIENITIILDNDPKLKGCLAYDELDMLTAVRRDLPWRTARDRRGKTWQNGDDAALRLYLEKHYGISGKEKILDAVETVSKAHSFHPIREYLTKCQWDGVPRMDTVLIRYLGAEDTEYTRAVTRKTFVAAVARALVPGIKFDYILTLRGKQGIGKSTLIARLAGDWFSDSINTVQGKEAYEQLRRAWIVELSELASMKKAEVEATKQFISKQVDQYRPAYGRTVEVFPRQCIFIGTTNEKEFLRDATGNRRFWIVDTPNSENRTDFRAELDDATVMQIWAEAKHHWDQGEPLYLEDRLEAEARAIQDSYAEVDDRFGMVQAYLERLLPEDWGEKDLYERREWLQSGAEGTVARSKVCRMEVWCEVLGGSPGKIDRYESKAIGPMLERCGWAQETTGRFGLYGIQRVFRKRS